jgi:hypothetical protein
MKPTKTRIRLLNTPWAAAALAVAAIALATTPADAAGVCQVGVLNTSGINPATGLEWAPGDTYRLVFITSTTTTAASADIATYNAFVNTVADSSTTFLALGSVNWSVVGSTATVDARDNTGTNSGTGVPLLTMTSTTVAINNADLWDGTSNIVNRDQNGFSVTATQAFTGTLPDGTRVTGAADQPLGSFGSGLGNIRTGYSDLAGNLWMSIFNQVHTEPLPVFAMSEVLTVAAIPEPSAALLGGLGMLALLRRRR